MDDKTIRSAVMIAAFTALIIVGAIFNFPIPWNPVVPFTLATLFVILSGMIMGPIKGLISVGLYLFLGLIGLPVFAQSKGGLGVLAGPTGGFLIGYLLGAFTAGILGRSKGTAWLIIAAFAGSLAIYFTGTPWMHYQLRGKVENWSWASTWVKYTAPFLAIDAIKALLAVIVVRSFGKRA